MDLFGDARCSYAAQKSSVCDETAINKKYICVLELSDIIKKYMR